MALTYFIYQAGMRAGPFAENEIRERRSRGELGPADLVWAEGWAGWTPLGSIPEFSIDKVPVETASAVEENTLASEPAAAKSGPRPKTLILMLAIVLLSGMVGAALATIYIREDAPPIAVVPPIAAHVAVLAPAPAVIVPPPVPPPLAPLVHAPDVRPEAALPGNIEVANSGRDVPRERMLINEDGVLIGQSAMCVAAEGGMGIIPAADIKDDIEESLRAAGIKVLPLEDGSYPRLVLSIDAESGTASDGAALQDYIIVSVQLSFRRLYPTHVPDRPEKFVEGTVWKAAFSGTILKTADVRERIRNDLTAAFIQAYKNANHLK